MSPLARKVLRVLVEQLRDVLAELEDQDDPAQQAIAGKPAKKKGRPKKTSEGGLAALAALDAPTVGDNRIVLVCIDGKPPTLAMVTDESPKPGFKTIRLARGNKGARRFSRKERRVLDSEVRRDATAEECSRGLGRSRLNGHAAAAAA